jgi:two-component system, NtrC family, sensor kinase
MVQSAVRLCDGLYAVMCRFDGELIHFAAQHNLTPEGLEAVRRTFPVRPTQALGSGRAILRRAVVHIPDVEVDPEYVHQALRRAVGFRSGLWVPMMREGAPIGVIAVVRAAPGPFSDNQIELLKTFADQAVIAVENVRLFQELRARTADLTRSVEQLTALGEVSRAVSSTLDLDTVLDTIVTRAKQLAGTDGCTIYEYDEASEAFRLRASRFAHPHEATVLDPIARATPIPKGQGLAGRAALLREPVHIPDIAVEGAYESPMRAPLLQAGYRALLGVPLLREEQVVGVLAVIRKTPGDFGPEVVRVLMTFATQSALAIQNARLFREIEEKSRQLEAASRHKSEFLANMSHELRTPLNAILGFNEMILGQIYGEVPADLREPLTDIQQSGKHLLRLINHVLDLSKIEAGRMELALTDYAVQDIVERVRASLQSLAAEKGLAFVATVSADIPLAYGDGGRITQCLMNLAGNALKFTHRGRVELGVELQGDVLVYRVTDTGIGIAPDKIEGVFTEFRQGDATITSEFGGTGLGLSITRKFVEMHGGRIWVESEVGRGSTFFFAIPVRLTGGTPA